MVCATLHLFIAAVTICSALGQNTDGNVSDSVTQPTDNVNTSIQPIDTNTTAATVGFTSTNADSSSSSPLSTFSVQYSISSTATSQTASGNISQPFQPPTQTTSMNELDPSPTECISSMNQFLKPTTSANHSSIAQTNPSLPNEPTLQSTSSVNQSLSQPTSTIPLMNQSLSEPTSTIPLVNQLSTSITQPTSSSNEPTLQSTPAPSSVNQSLSQPTSTIPLVNQSLSQPTSTIPLVNQSLSQPTSTIPLGTSRTTNQPFHGEPVRHTNQPSMVNQRTPLNHHGTAHQLTIHGNQPQPTQPSMAGPSVNQSLSQPTSTIPLVNQSLSQPTSTIPLVNQSLSQPTSTIPLVNQSLSQPTSTIPLVNQLSTSITQPTSSSNEPTLQSTPAPSSVNQSIPTETQATSPFSPPLNMSITATPNQVIPTSDNFTVHITGYIAIDVHLFNTDCCDFLLDHLAVLVPYRVIITNIITNIITTSIIISITTIIIIITTTIIKIVTIIIITIKIVTIIITTTTIIKIVTIIIITIIIIKIITTTIITTIIIIIIIITTIIIITITIIITIIITTTIITTIITTTITTIIITIIISYKSFTSTMVNYIAGLLHVKPELIKEVEIKKPKTNSRWARHLQQDIEGIHFRLLSQDRQASKKILNSLKNSSVILDGQEAVLETIMQGEWAIYSGNGTPTPVGGQGKLSAGAITGIVIVCIVGVLVIVLFLGAICTIASRRRKYGTYEFELPHTDAMSNGIKADPISEKVVR
ncbi:hypothetical protein EMCRGX_G021133 [Ephydatia muelleri]